MEWELLINHFLLQVNLRWSQHAYEMYYAETVLLQSKHHGKNTVKRCVRNTQCQQCHANEQYTKEWIQSE